MGPTGGFAGRAVGVLTRLDDDGGGLGEVDGGGEAARLDALVETAAVTKAVASEVDATRGDALEAMDVQATYPPAIETARAETTRALRAREGAGSAGRADMAAGFSGDVTSAFATSVDALSVGLGAAAGVAG